MIISPLDIPMVAREGRSCHCETFRTDRLTPWGLSELIWFLGDP